MSGDCQDCSFSEVMPDGFLFCLLYEQQTHGNQSCQCWTNDPSLFIEISEKGFGFDED